jgi:hypothetical protein
MGLGGAPRNDGISETKASLYSLSVVTAGGEEQRTGQDGQRTHLFLIPYLIDLQYLNHDHEVRSRISMVNTQPPPSETLPYPGGSATLQSSDLVSSLPAPLLRLLVIFARPIAAGKVGLEILLWKPGRRVESWLVVLIWWAVCLGGRYAFK